MAPLSDAFGRYLEDIDPAPEAWPWPRHENHLCFHDWETPAGVGFGTVSS